MKQTETEILKSKVRDLLGTLRAIIGNCTVYQDMESDMSAGDFLDLIEQDARNAVDKATK